MNNDWNSIINADLKDAEFTGGKPIPDGDYKGHIVNVTAKTFRSGGKGFEVQYALTVLDDKGTPELQTLRDYFVIVLADGKTNRSGPASMKKLILECGVTPAELATFNFPAYDSLGFGSLIKLFEKPLILSVKNTVQKKGENAGKSFPRVKSFRSGATAAVKAA